MSHIQLLSPLVANQIAAGEVIERPASVVKECLENALDAKATHITVDIGFGGLNHIIISDNGTGIHAADLHLAVTAHATSKIQDVSDLASIQTMGFRGEALASIASISRLTIQSRTQDAACAMQLIGSEEGLDVIPCAREVGTTVMVHDLFYNAPVRKRFLSAMRTEFLAIERVVRCFACSAPAVQLDLFHQGKKIFTLPQATTEMAKRQRVGAVLGKAFLEAALPVEAVFEGISIRGFIAQPEYARSQQDRLWVYVNQRMVSDKLLNHAVKKAYEPVLFPGRYPACLLYIDIDPACVDVNVHPTKHELRFHHPRQVHDAIYLTLSRLLASPKENIQPVVTGLAYTQAAPTLEGGHWIACGQFALWVQLDQTWLVHTAKLRRDILRKQCQTSAFPWAHRPLLVPVQVTLTQKNMVLLEANFNILSQLGITLSFVGTETVMVRTIPVVTPHLAIVPFIQAILQEEGLTLERAIEAVLTHQSVGEILPLEQKDLQDYLMNCTETQRQLYMKQLSDPVCQELFDE